MSYKLFLSKLSNSNLYNLILSETKWPYINKIKKHKSLDHYRTFHLNPALFYNKWKGISGIYKITYLNCKFFTYYGSSKNLGSRLKYHYYTTPKMQSFLGLFLNLFTWKSFSITIIETCSPNLLKSRENWYLNKFKPLLNMNMESYINSNKTNSLNIFTKLKISNSLKGKTHNELTKLKMSNSKKGVNNPNYLIGPSKNTLEAAVKILGKKIYVYDKNLNFINNAPFNSFREASNYTKISRNTLSQSKGLGYWIII
jgi:group I intron endonuclease